MAADYADLVERDDVDIVYCALPPSLHAEWCRAALAAGKPVVTGNKELIAANGTDLERAASQAGVDLPQPHEAAHHEAGADEQHQR